MIGASPSWLCRRLTKCAFALCDATIIVAFDGPCLCTPWALSPHRSDVGFRLLPFHRLILDLIHMELCHDRSPRIKTTDAATVATIALQVPKEEMQQHFGPAITEIMDVVSEQGIEVVGPVLAHHFGMTAEVFDFEICVPVAEPIEASGRVQPSTLPAQKVVETTYRGPYEGLPDAWAEFQAWIDEQELALKPDVFERYVDGIVCYRHEGRSRDGSVSTPVMRRDS